VFKRTFQFLLLGCLVTGALWAANDPFVGNWDLNPSRSKLTDQMKVASIAANKYAFDFGGGSAETIAAGRTDQPANFGTTRSVTIEGPDFWKVVGKKGGRILLAANWKLAKDGNTLTDDFTAIQPNGSAFSLNDVYKRAAKGPGFVGAWESTSETLHSVFVLQVRP
jgi:hypothetical protein